MNEIIGIQNFPYFISLPRLAGMSTAVTTPDALEPFLRAIADSHVRARISGLDEHLCRVECDGETVTGIYQTNDPLAYENCAAGKPGWAFLD